METIKLPCMKTLPTAWVPSHATSKSVGLDLYRSTNVLVPAHGKVLVDLGIALQIPMGYYGWIASRSGLAIHHHIHVGAGVVDPWLYWIYSCVTDELQFSRPCYRKESSNSPDDSRKSGLSDHLWGISKCSQQSGGAKGFGSQANKTY